MVDTPGVGGGGYLQYTWQGVKDGASYCNPPPQKKKKLHEPESLLPKKDLASKFPTQQ